MTFRWASSAKAPTPPISFVFNFCSSRCPSHSDPGCYEETDASVLDEGLSRHLNPWLSDPIGQAFKAVSKESEMHLTRAVYEEIMKALTSRPPEAGGLLLGPRNHHAVTHFYLDETARATATTFTLDDVGMNRVLKDYKACGIDAKGIVHSHPHGCRAPSNPDLEYVRRLFANPKNAETPEILLPIVCGGKFLPYVITREDGQKHSLKPAPAKLVLF